jgi:hypothetical protein
MAGELQTPIIGRVMGQILSKNDQKTTGKTGDPNPRNYGWTTIAET